MTMESMSRKQAAKDGLLGIPDTDIRRFGKDAISTFIPGFQGTARTALADLN